MDRRRHIHRIKGLLAGYGVWMPIKNDFLKRLKAVRKWDGTPVSPGLQARLKREYERLLFVRRRIKELEADLN
jgi:hypothetical protein